MPAEEMKKWMFTLPSEQVEWLKARRVAGVVVVRHLIGKAMEDKSGRLDAELSSVQDKIELQKINDSIAELEQKRQEYLRTSRREKVTA
jgi:hypothetical protein